MKVGDIVRLKSTVRAEQLGFHDWDGNDVSHEILPLRFRVTMVDLKYHDGSLANRTFVENHDDGLNFGSSFPNEWLEMAE